MSHGLKNILRNWPSWKSTNGSFIYVILNLVLHCRVNLNLGNTNELNRHFKALEKLSPQHGMRNDSVDSQRWP